MASVAAALKLAAVCMLLLYSIGQQQNGYTVMAQEQSGGDTLVSRLDEMHGNLRKQCFSECAGRCYCADHPYQCFQRCLAPIQNCEVAESTLQAKKRALEEMFAPPSK